VPLNNLRKPPMSDFAQKFWLSVIDKVVLSLIAAIFLVYVQDSVKSDSSFRDQAYLSSKVYTDLLVEYRKKTTLSIETYLPIIESAKTLGQIEDQDSLDTMSKVLSDIRMIHATVSEISPSLAIETQALVEEISRSNVRLSFRKQDAAQVEGIQESVLGRYNELIKAFRSTIKEVLFEEYKK
jgi:hypothetical protein